MISTDSSPSPTYPTNGKTHHSGLRYLLIILGVLLVAGGGVLAYEFLHKQPTPEEMWAQVSENLSSVKTMSYQGTVSLVSHREKTIVAYFGSEDGASTEIGVNTSTMIFQFSGVTDWRDSVAPKGSLVVNADISPDPDLTMKLGFETRNIGDVVYAKLTAVPLLGMFDLGSIKDMWIRADMRELQKKYGSELVGLAPAASSVSSTDELSTDQVRQIREAFFREHVIEITGKASSDTIGGMAMHRLTYVVEPEAFWRFVSSTLGILDPESSGLALLGPETGMVSDWSRPMYGEIWVGKKNLLPYKVTVNTEILVPGMGFGTSTTQVSVSIAMNNYNEPTTIEAPTDATSVDELIASFTSGFSSAQSASSTVIGDSFASGDADQDGLTDAEEQLLYSTNPNKADTDGDGYPDGEEVQNGYNPNGPGKMPR